MGTDISAVVERREDGIWTAVSPLKIARDKNLFGILAGVGRDHTPIAYPRGLPTDRDPKSGDVFGDHSHSWLTLSELRSYDWGTRFINEGCIPLRDVDRDDPFYSETYAEWKTTEPHVPRAWSGGLSSAELLDLRPREYLVAALYHVDKYVRAGRRRDLAKRDLDATRAEQYLADPKLMPPPEESGWRRERRPRTVWAHVAWTITAREACAPFCAWLDETKELPGDDTRIVFGFG